VIGSLLGQLQAAEASRQLMSMLQPASWDWSSEQPKFYHGEQEDLADTGKLEGEHVIGPDGAVYDVFYPWTDEKEETSTTCSDSGGSPGSLPRRSAEASIAGVVDFIRNSAVARYPQRANLYDVVRRAARSALGDHFERLALIGSTALRIDTPDSDLDVVVYTCSSYDVPGPDPIEALRKITKTLREEDPALKLQLVDCARVPVLTVLSADGRLSLDLTIDQPLGEWHVLWFQSLWQWDPYTTAAYSVDTLPPPIQDGELGSWSSGLEATALRCIKWWLRRRNIPVPKEGGYPTVVWTLMVLHVLRCSLFVNEDSKQERSGRALLGALAAFFDRFASPRGSAGTLSFCMGPDGMSTAFEPQPNEDAWEYTSDEVYSGLSVLDPTTTCEHSVAFGVVPSELAPQLPGATRLLHAYELQRAQRLSATALASCGEDSSEADAGAEALEELFMETSTPCNTMPSSMPSQPVSVIVLRDGELAIGILQQVAPKPGWTAPFLHRRDAQSAFAVQLCEVRESDGLLTPWERTREQWYYACDFVSLAALQPVFTRGQCRGKHLRRDRNRWKVDPEGLERWQRMHDLLSQVGLHC